MNLEKLEKKIGYTFKNKEFIKKCINTYIICI